MTVVAATMVAFAVAGLLTAALFRSPTRRPTSDRVPEQRAPTRPTVRIGLRRAPSAVEPASLAAWADDLSRALRHGSTLHAALLHTLPTDPVIERHSRPLRHWLERGATVAEASDEWSNELHGDHIAGRRHRDRAGGRPELLATMAAVLAAAATLGGSAARPLDRFAATMRKRASDDLERSAQSAQARMSARVLTSIPIAVLALLVITDADVRAVITSATGGSAVAAGIVLNTAGALWMRRIVAGSGRSAW